MDVTHHVIRPRHGDEEHKRVKPDRTDAFSLHTALDRFAAGNPHTGWRWCVYPRQLSIVPATNAGCAKACGRI